MYINDHKLSKMLKGKKDPKDKIKIFLLDSSKTIMFELSKSLDKIECLSLRNNFLKDVSFLQYFPMLFYLDISNNPIEDFEQLNKYNSFAYLGLTAPQNFLEKKILIIKGLNIAILDLEIRNKSFKEQFIKNNPNIFLFNGYFYSFNEKIALINCIDYLRFTRLSLAYNSADNQPEKIGKEIHDLIGNTKDNINNLARLNDKFNVVNNNPKNPFVKELVSFIEKYNKIMVEYITNESEQSLSAQNFKESSPMSNQTSSVNTYNNKANTIKIIQKEEQKRLLILSNYYQQIAKYNSMIDCAFVYNKILKSLQKSASLNNLKKEYKNINFKLFQLKTIPMQLLVLSILYLYMIGIFSKEISCEILHSFHIKYNTQECPNLREDIESFFNIEYLYFVCFYYEIYNYFSCLYKELKISETEDEKNKIDFGVIKYNDLRKSLKMLKLTTVVSSLELYHKSAGELTKINEANVRNDLIQSIIINYLIQENIYKETLQIVQFVNDFLLFNKYESILVKDLANDYRLFHEIKEQLYKNISQTKDSLSEQKYKKIKTKTLTNKYFFLTNQYSNFTSIGTKHSLFFSSPKTTFYPNKAISNYKNRSIDYAEANEHRNAIKLTKDLQNTLSIKLEKKAIKTKMVDLPKTTLFKKKLFSVEPKTSKLPKTSNIFNYEFFCKKMKQRKSQSMTCLFSKAKKLPKIQFKPKMPKCTPNSIVDLNKISIDEQNRVSLRFNAFKRNESPLNTHTMDSLVAIDPKIR